MYIWAIISLLVVSNANPERRLALDVTNTTNQNQRQNRSDALKLEIAKYLKDCGTDESREDSAENDRRTKHDGSGGTYPEFYGEENKQGTEENGDKKRFSNKSDQTSGCNENYNGRSNKNFDRNDRRNNERGENRNYRDYAYRNYPDVPGDPFNANENVGYGNVGFGNRRGFPLYDVDNFRSSSGMMRVKRDDENCVSQCVFSYMEMLDDNRVPSETAVVKFLKDHVPNDRKRIAMIRDARRCFARLATMDNEDGCEFSKSLAKCLKLDME